MIFSPRTRETGIDIEKYADKHLKSEDISSRYMGL